ncbi:MAG: cytochrome c biogenesis protein CcdA [Bacteroidetes bacterium]|nr:cytochrome c biogenesis protein CcdA [Bacteroidota bacterium]
MGKLQEISVLVAFAAGVISFLSPCVLPLVPAYLGHLAGVSVASERSRSTTLLSHALAFVLGFSVVFVALWASVGLVGYLVRDLTPYLREVGGAILVVMGLHVAGVLQIPALYRERTYAWRQATQRSLPGSFLVGVLFAAGWTPCIGPILAGIIGLASLSETVGQGIYLLIAYSAGLGVPFLVAAWLWGSASRRLPSLGRYHRYISLASGALLIVIGVLMLTNVFSQMSRYFQWTVI